MRKGYDLGWIVGIALCAFINAMGPVNAATKKDLDAETAKLRAHERAITAVRDNIAAALGLPKKGTWDNGCLVLSIAAEHRPTTSVQLLRRKGDWAQGVANLRGHAPRGKADGSKLSIGKDALQGALTVTLTPFPHTQGYPYFRENYHDCAPRTYVYELELQINGFQVSGTAKGQGREWQCTGTFVPLVHPKYPRVPLGSGEEDDPLVEAKWLEGNVARVYDQIRALSMTGRLGLPYDLAIKQIPRYSFKRPIVKGDGGGKGKGKEKARKNVPSIDDMGMDDMDLGGGAAATQENYKPLVEQARRISARTQRLLDLARLQEKEGDKVKPVPPGGLKLDDPEFGPWFDVAPLRGTKGKNNIVPADAGGPGDQQWSYVNHWHCVGPISDQALWPIHATLLPDLIPVPDTDCVVSKDILGRELYVAGKLSKPGVCMADSANGLTRPPNWRAGDKYTIGEYLHSPGIGLDHSSCYAFTELHSDEDKTLFAGAVVNDTGALWVNDRLVWDSGDHPLINKTMRQVFKVDLRKGRNTVIMRARDRQHPTWFGLFLCTRGAPRDAASFKAAVAARDAAYATLKLATDGTVGWRGDRRGNYPGAEPVTAWDLEKRINVVWRRPMPKSCTGLVLVDDNLFTVSEPYFLECVDPNTGETRWKGRCSPLELKAKDVFEKEMKPLEERLSKVRGKEREALQKEINALLAKHECPNATFSGGVCNLFSTPISDGEHVWAKIANTVGCFDMAGNRKWLAETESKDMASLLLVDGVLVDADPRSNPLQITAWDAATGKELWKKKGGKPPKWLCGSPGAMRLTNGKENMVVVIAATCDTFRLADGKRLLADVEFQHVASKEFDTMFVDHDVLYISRNFARGSTAEIAAYRFVMIDRDTVGAVPLWSTLVKNDSYCGLMKHGNRLMQLTGGGVEGRGKLWIMDIVSGQLQPPVEKLAGTGLADQWVPPCMVGDTLYINDSWRGGPTMNLIPNNMSAIRMTPKPHVIARNRMERMIGAPTFKDDKIYLRTFNSFMCLGYTGEEGKRYEAEVNARTVLAAIMAVKPDVSDPIVPKPTKSKWFGGLHPLRPDRIIGGWTYAGPFPKDLRNKARDAIGIPSFKCRLGEKPKGSVTVNGTKFPVAKKEDKNRFHGAWKDVAWRYRPYINVTATVKEHQNAVSYWYTQISSYGGVLRFEMDAPGVTVWINGTEIKYGQRVRLAGGHFAMVMEVAIDEVPADGVKISPIFRDSSDPKAELAARLEHLKLHKPTLERVVKLSPDSDIGKLSARLLGEL